MISSSVICFMISCSDNDDDDDDTSPGIENPPSTPQEPATPQEPGTSPNLKISGSYVTGCSVDNNLRLGWDDNLYAKNKLLITDSQIKIVSLIYADDVCEEDLFDTFTLTFDYTKEDQSNDTTVITRSLTSFKFLPQDTYFPLNTQLYGFTTDLDLFNDGRNYSVNRVNIPSSVLESLEKDIIIKLNNNKLYIDGYNSESKTADGKEIEYTPSSDPILNGTYKRECYLHNNDDTRWLGGSFFQGAMYAITTIDIVDYSNLKFRVRHTTYNDEQCTDKEQEYTVDYSGFTPQNKYENYIVVSRDLSSIGRKIHDAEYLTLVNESTEFGINDWVLGEFKNITTNISEQNRNDLTKNIIVRLEGNKLYIDGYNGSAEGHEVEYTEYTVE